MKHTNSKGGSVTINPILLWRNLTLMLRMHVIAVTFQNTHHIVDIYNDRFSGHCIVQDLVVIKPTLLAQTIKYSKVTRIKF